MLNKHDNLSNALDNIKLSTHTSLQNRPQHALLKPKDTRQKRSKYDNFHLDGSSTAGLCALIEKSPEISCYLEGNKVAGVGEAYKRPTSISVMLDTGSLHLTDG